MRGFGDYGSSDGFAKAVEAAVQEVASEDGFKAKVKDLVKAEFEKALPKAIESFVFDKVQAYVRDAFNPYGEEHKELQAAVKTYVKVNRETLQGTIEKTATKMLAEDTYVHNLVRNYFGQVVTDMAREAVNAAAKNKAQRDARAAKKAKKS